MIYGWEAGFFEFCFTRANFFIIYSFVKQMKMLLFLCHVDEAAGTLKCLQFQCLKQSRKTKSECSPFCSNADDISVDTKRKCIDRLPCKQV